MVTALGQCLKGLLALTRMSWVIKCCGDFSHKHFPCDDYDSIGKDRMTISLHKQDGISK